MDSENLNDPITMHCLDNYGVVCNSNNKNKFIANKSEQIYHSLSYENKMEIFSHTNCDILHEKL